MRFASFAPFVLLLACQSSSSATDVSIGAGVGGSSSVAGAGGKGGAAGAEAGVGGATGGVGGAGGMTCTDGVVAASKCATTFGTEMSAAFGRIDGTLHAIVRPQDKQCSMPNSTHIALDVEMNGALYRLLARVYDDQTPGGMMFYAEKDASLPAPAFSPGWHAGATLGYVSNLGVHVADFKETPQAPLIQDVLCAVTLGDPIAIYATGYGPDGGHDVHKTTGNAADGAIVVRPDQPTSRFLLFHFVNQTF
jgi:hypothetical protein